MKVVVVLVLVLIVGCFARKTIDNVHIALGGDATSMCVSWLTADQTATNTVKYGTVPNQYTFTATSDDQNSYDSNAGWNHNVVLTGLSPATTYYYICGDSNYAFSQEFNFTSLQSSFVPTTIAVYGDLGTDNSANTISQLNQHATRDELSLFVHLGDISYANDHPLEYERTWNKWFASMEPAMAHTPYMVSVGNHESWCRNPICAEATKNFTTYNDKFRMPGNESGSGTNMFYSFDYYNIHFVAISTETDYPGAPHWDPAPENVKEYLQANWLDADLSAAVANRANVPWIILFGHRTIYSPTEQDNGVPTGQAAQVQAFFEPYMQKYNVDLYLAGHVHDYSRTYPVYNNNVTSYSYYNPPSTTHIVSGAAGCREKLAEFPDTFPSWYANGNDSLYGYGTLTVYNDTTLTWGWYRSDTDALVDSFTLTRFH